MVGCSQRKGEKSVDEKESRYLKRLKKERKKKFLKKKHRENGGKAV
jgi:hypothetical protein